MRFFISSGARGRSSEWVSSPATIVKCVTTSALRPGGRGDLEIARARFSGLQRHRIRAASSARAGQLADRERDGGGLAAAVREGVAEAVVDAAVGADPIERAAVGRHAHQHGLPHGERGEEPAGVEQQDQQHDDRGGRPRLPAGFGDGSCSPQA